MRDASTAPDPALLERLRRGIPLRLDRLGDFHLDGEPVTHPRVIDVLHAGLDVSEAGEPQLHFGDQWCYLTIDDAFFRVRTVALDPAGPTVILRLDDGRDLPLDPATLWEEPGLGLRATVPARRSGRPLPVRFTNRAQVELAEWIDLDHTPPLLHVGERAWPIEDHPPG